MKNFNQDHWPDKKSLRQQLIEQRLHLPQRQHYLDALHQVLRVWLLGRSDSVIGAYWPIKGEFNPLALLQRWQEEGALLKRPALRQIGLPVVDAPSKSMAFHAWHPGCLMQNDAYGIARPSGTAAVTPTLLLIACLACAPGGYRLGYGGGFYDRLLAKARPRPFTVGLGFGPNFLIDFKPAAHDIPLDVILNENGVLWPP